MGSQGVEGSVCVWVGGERGKGALVLAIQTVAVGAVNICSSFFKRNLSFS